jgi:hypothetical protein
MREIWSNISDRRAKFRKKSNTKDTKNVESEAIEEVETTKNKIDKSRLHNFVNKYFGRDRKKNKTQKWESPETNDESKENVIKIDIDEEIKNILKNSKNSKNNMTQEDFEKKKVDLNSLYEKNR